MSESPRFFRWYSVGTLTWTLLVIVWGAYVRATGSGAGCGDHWPNCNGQFIPRSPSIQTLIEYTHRATSGIALVSVVLLVVLAFVYHPAKAPVRRAAVWCLVLMLTEALLGALLVKFEWVANNASANRAAAMSIHLINTFLLLAALSSCVFWAFRGSGSLHLNAQGTLGLTASLLVLALGVTGSVTALGDTLAQQSVFNSMVDWMIRLRLIHPLFALSVSMVLLAYAARTLHLSRLSAVTLGSLTLLQLALGLVNVLLKAPVSAQLLHLLVADGVWIALVTCTLSNLWKQEPLLVSNPVLA